MIIVIALSTLIGAYLFLMGLRVLIFNKALRYLREHGSIVWKFYGGWSEESGITSATVRWIYMPGWIIMGLFLLMNGLCFFFPSFEYCSTGFFQVTAW